MMIMPEDCHKNVGPTEETLLVFFLMEPNAIT